MKGKNVLITGGAGFIGTNLTFALLEQSANVSVLVLPRDDCSHFPSEVRILRTNVNDKEELAGLFEGQQFVFHLAARCDLDGKQVSDYKTNYEGTVNVIEEIKTEKSLKRFVLYSTQLVVGIFNETRFIDESEPYRTKTPYGESKILAEKYTVELCKKYNIPFTIIRPTSVYGPYGKEPYESFFRMIREGKYFHIGKADNLVSMTYVKNLIHQTILLSTLEQAEDEIFFGNDFHPYTMRQFAETAARYYGRRLLTVPDVVAYPAAYVLGIFKSLGLEVPLYPFRLRNIKANYCYDMQSSVRLGYLPKYDLQSGIYQTLDWYEQNLWNKKPL